MEAFDTNVIVRPCVRDDEEQYGRAEPIFRRATAGAHVSALEIRHVGTAAHHAPEDSPEPMAGAIDDWLTRHAL